LPDTALRETRDPRPGRYRISTKPDGAKVWWQAHEAIPPNHTAIRDANAEEAALMDKLLQSKGAPSLALGDRITAMLQRNGGPDDRHAELRLMLRLGRLLGAVCHQSPLHEQVFHLVCDVEELLERRERRPARQPEAVSLAEQPHWTWSLSFADPAFDQSGQTASLEAALGAVLRAIG
jgi:hypothetical protein